VAAERPQHPGQAVKASTRCRPGGRCSSRKISAVWTGWASIRSG